MSILIVEDNPTNGLILKHLVKKVSQEEIIVESEPAKALQLCHMHDFSLLLVDQMLPGMTGLQFFRTLRRLPRYRDIPAVMVTADTSGDLRDKAMNAGVTAFLTKPVEALSFRSLMATLLPREAADTDTAL